jgi:hypothetical protein
LSLSISFFLYFLTLSLQWISFIHTFKRELKNHMGLLQVNTKNLCTFLYLWGVGRGRISFVLHFFLFERVWKSTSFSKAYNCKSYQSNVTPLSHTCKWKATSKKKHRHVHKVNPRTQLNTYPSR